MKPFESTQDAVRHFDQTLPGDSLSVCYLLENGKYWVYVRHSEYN